MTNNNITIQCPATGAILDTGVETTATSLADVWNKRLRVRCPHCKAEHSGFGRELFTAEVMSSCEKRADSRDAR